jgi:hypothetical protein
MNAYAKPIDHLFANRPATMGKVLAIVDRHIVIHVIKGPDIIAQRESLHIAARRDPH